MTVLFIQKVTKCASSLLVFWLVGCVSFLSVPKANANPNPQIMDLQDSLRLWTAKRDSLRHEQGVVQAVVDSFAQQVARLKLGHGGGAATGDLALALRKSLNLSLKLEQLYEAEILAGDQIAKVTLMLREAYDAEIDRLITLLDTEASVATITALQALRRARQALPPPQTQQTMPTVTVGLEDTPDDIVLKAELMADVAQQLAQERSGVQKELKRLVEERRLRGRVRAFATEFDLFDEASAQGRSVSAPLVAQPKDETQGVIQAPEFGFAGNMEPATEPTTEASPPGERLDVPPMGNEITLDGLGPTVRAPEGTLEAEIWKLEQRERDLLAKEQRAQRRVERLKQYLEQLLEGQRP